MLEENTTPTPQSAETPQQPAESPPSPDSKPAPTEGKPAVFTFSQKIQLVKKKYEYINKQGMDAVAAEAAARRDFGFPEMTAAEREKAAKPNIFQRILNSKLFVALGITALISGKKTDSKEKADEKLAPTSHPAESSESAQAFSDAVSSEKAKEVEVAAPETTETKPPSAEASPSVENVESKPEGQPPQNPEN